ncbi:MAG: isoleucine--tRNA ligase [Rhizobiales bacterium NRL2]|jgi:isoleucyl-tRNA synthetase|nr:MAG: isoleucine--tRNA ligase [Rhizobiales bacterium NRL2]
MTRDYKDTVFLPKTDFPMRAGLPQKEPEMLERWERMEIWKKLRESSKGREKFILHDGPPYANGDIHMGHVLNKVLKDVINRSRQMMGYDANYVPGWDCHGLPIEWKIEEKYRKAGRNKDEVPVNEFRRECREFADHWIDVQREGFKRLGVFGDWERPYLTMDYKSEAVTVAELLKFLMDGSLYKGSKAVMWSVVEKTSLAEAEIEYHDHTSTTIWVRFPVIRTEDPALEGASIVIWTTTPWTIPGNRALAYGEEIDYGVYQVEAVAEGSLAKAGEKLALADALAESVREAAGIESWTKVAEVTKPAGTVCRHPLSDLGYTYEDRLLPADYVTTDQGTGFVHIAPGHGAEDFDLGVENGVEVPDTVAEDGLYYPHVPHFAGMHVFKVDGPMIETLTGHGGLLAHGKITHSYPHSWRSKAPLIFRNAPQWFISMEKTGIREKALKAISETAFYPKSGQRRLNGMIENRPDWLLSRQRVWGVPITVFVDKRTGEPLRDERVNERILEAIQAEGCDAWFGNDAAFFLGDDYSADDYEKASDILDVWFDSGTTHAFCLEMRDDLKWPADLYLEGTDQHRGWFHSSLLESCGTRGRAPYDAVLTHGFILDEKAEKMSKSSGNALGPKDVFGQYGADILRLWVAAADYTEDLRFGPGILKATADSYRRLRNTLRFLLGNLHDFEESERLDPAEMPELDRYLLHRLAVMDRTVREALAVYDFHDVFVALHNFCAIELSSFYFDIRKDVLYCDRPDSIRRRATRTVLDRLYHCLVTWFAPILAFTAEEAWQSRYPDENDSVHLKLFPEAPSGWLDDTLAEKWNRIFEIRRVVTGALEVERREKRIGASLQASPVVYLSADDASKLEGLDMAGLFITSGAAVSTEPAPADAFRLEDVDGVAVSPRRATGAKCGRCWMVLEEVPEEGALCNRCSDAVAVHDAAAA